MKNERRLACISLDCSKSYHNSETSYPHDTSRCPECKGELYYYPDTLINAKQAQWQYGRRWHLFTAYLQWINETPLPVMQGKVLAIPLFGQNHKDFKWLVKRVHRKVKREERIWYRLRREDMRKLRRKWQKMFRERNKIAKRERAVNRGWFKSIKNKL